MNDYLYEITKDVDEEIYTDMLRSQRRRITNTISEGEENYEVICM